MLELKFVHVARSELLPKNVEVYVCKVHDGHLYIEVAMEDVGMHVQVRHVSRAWQSFDRELHQYEIDRIGEHFFTREGKMHLYRISHEQRIVHLYEDV